MSRRSANVTQAAISRALRAVKQVAAERVIEIAPDGTIRLIPAAPSNAPGAQHGDRLEPQGDIVL